MLGALVVVPRVHVGLALFGVVLRPSGVRFLATAFQPLPVGATNRLAGARVCRDTRTAPNHPEAPLPVPVRESRSARPCSAAPSCIFRRCDGTASTPVPPEQTANSTALAVRVRICACCRRNPCACCCAKRIPSPRRDEPAETAHRSYPSP